MKKIILIGLLIWMATTNATAQDDEINTLFGDSIKYGFYMGPVLKVSPVNDVFGVWIGGKGGIMIDHKLMIGGAGYGLTTYSRFDKTYPDYTNNDSLQTFNIATGYGGMLFEYTVMSYKAIHLSIPVLIGGGGAAVNYRYDYDHNNLNGVVHGFNRTYEHSSYFIVEPGVDIEFNILKHFRIDLGASYRLATGSNLNLVNDKQLSGYSMNMGLKFGFF